MANTVVFADYHNPTHAQDLVMLLNAYAEDPMGGGEPLPTFTQDNLIKALQEQPQVLSLICYVDDKPAGLVNCVKAFRHLAPSH